MEHDVGMVRK